MAVISFSDDRAWVKARWAVFRVLSDMLVICPDDPQLRVVLDQAIALGGICVELVEEPVASRLIALLKDVIARSENESEPGILTWKTGLDDKAQLQYKQALRELREMIEP